MSDLQLPILKLADIHALDQAQTLVLTVNNRLARRLTTELIAGRSVSGTFATVLPWRTWIDSCADKLSFHDRIPLARHRLDDFGSRLLWQQTIEAHTDSLLDTFEASRLAADAHHLMHEWELQIGDVLHEEYAQFHGWQTEYLARLERLDADDAEARVATLLRALEHDEACLRLPTHIVLAGMRELSPRQRRLLAAMHQQGCSISVLDDDPGSTATIRRHQAADRGAEWRAAIAWARARLDRTDGCYAIIAINLQEDAPIARRILHTELSGHGFNMSVGRPVAEWPIAHAALAWLKLLTHAPPYPVEWVGKAMRTGYCAGDQSEASARVQLDAEWRWRELDRITEDLWWRSLRLCPSLHEAWDQARSVIASVDDTAPLNLWSEVLGTALKKLGFPGDTTLDSASFQALQAFNDLWRQLSSAAPAAGKISGPRAVALLERLAGETPFQPQRDSTARLDVLGALEAEGGRWDAVWVLGMTDDVLPAPPSPNPFLPTSALAAANAPRTTAARELAYAQTLYAALQCCAREMWVSHAHLDGERELRASPLIAAVAPADLELQEAKPAPARIRLQSVDRDPGPPLQSGQRVTGGAALLEAQSRNPLWAFVRFRLGARLLPAYARQTPMSALRGNFLHLAMQTLWLELENSRKLAQAMADGSLEERLERALAVAATAELTRLSPAVRELECERARTVLMAWLDIEAARTPFEVAHVEGAQAWEHGPLALNLRLDRIDRLPDRSLAILDYKSGTQLDLKGWARERPISLQLPFYATALVQGDGDVRIAALALVRLHAREVITKGLAGVELGLPGVAIPNADNRAADHRWVRDFEQYDWDGWLAVWRERIEALAEEFIAGYAENKVFEPNDLKFCDVMPFLRLNLELDSEEVGS